MTWVETTDGYVNLATARSARRTHDDDLIVYDADGEHHRLLVDRPRDFFGLRYSVIPAPGTQTLIVIHVELDPNLENPDFHTERYPIVGWRVDRVDGYAAPAIPGRQASDFGDNWIALIEAPDGRLIETVLDGEFFDTVEDAKNALVGRVRWHAKWMAERRQKDNAAP